MQEYNLKGRKMLNLDDIGMVDCNQYYLILEKSYKRRTLIDIEYTYEQQGRYMINMIEGEPKITGPSILYSFFLEELKDTKHPMYERKLKLYKNYSMELREEKQRYLQEIDQLLQNGYPFDKELKKCGYYIIKIDNEYFQYKLIKEKNAKIDSGGKLLSQKANISSYQFVPITIDDLQEIKTKVLNQRRPHSERFDKYYKRYCNILRLRDKINR